MECCTVSRHAAKVICMFMHVHACSSLPHYKVWWWDWVPNQPTHGLHPPHWHIQLRTIFLTLAVRPYSFSRNQSKSIAVSGIRDFIQDCFKLFLHSPGRKYCWVWFHMPMPNLAVFVRNWTFWKNASLSTVHGKYGKLRRRFGGMGAKRNYSEKLRNCFQPIRKGIAE